jgi:hypothetical protein
MGQTAKAPRENRTITVDFQDESTHIPPHYVVERCSAAHRKPLEVRMGRLSFQDQWQGDRILRGSGEHHQQVVFVETT